MSEGPKIRSGMRGTPPGFFSGIAKTYGRLNLVTGSMIHFAARLGPWTLIPVGLTVYLVRFVSLVAFSVIDRLTKIWICMKSS